MGADLSRVPGVLYAAAEESHGPDRRGPGARVRAAARRASRLHRSSALPYGCRLDAGRDRELRLYCSRGIGPCLLFASEKYGIRIGLRHGAPLVLEPLTAVVLTVIVFHVPFNAWEITGAACVILNMVLLALQDRKERIGPVGNKRTSSDAVKFCCNFTAF